MDDDLVIRPGRVVPAGELEERFMPSGGPGGQHANRSHTRVELRLDLTTTVAFSESERARLIERFGPMVAVVVDDERSQARNRSIARERLAGRIRTALAPIRTRVPTRPTKGSRTRRLEAKRRRGETKQQRQRPDRPHD